MIFILFLLSLAGLGRLTSCYPDEGRWQTNLTEADNVFAKIKSLYKGSQIFVNIVCKSDSPDSTVTVVYKVSESTCGDDSIIVPTMTKPAHCDGHHLTLMPINNGAKGPPSSLDKFEAVNSPENPDKKNVETPQRRKRDNKLIAGDTNVKKATKPNQRIGDIGQPIYTILRDGIYNFTIAIEGTKFNAEVEVEMMSDFGYLSAQDWPLLPFYGAMCLIYIIFGAAWLLVSFCQWRDLLRIQFWIGGVILLGMLEKATFYAEYQSINHTGVSVKGAVLLAEWVSCGKRTLARMLVIIVSLGFGIVKPRLGPMLHRVVGVGACYFILAVVESYIRVMNSKSNPSNQLLIATIPLAVLDSGICWWIFTSLVQTTRTLRLRRNLVKLNLYRHFTNTLIFAVLASVIFMLYSIKAHHLAICIKDWKELWIDEAYWHILFSVLLLVIMILWRPTNNNQRYAFTPLLDAADDDEEEDQFVNDAYGVKMRTHSRASSPKPKPSSDDDILKWVDENIPSAGVETALPILDSEEEILTTKFEVSKMQ